MKVTAESIPEARVVLEVEVDDERFQRSMTWAYRRLASNAKIPGFRPGKAPRALVERTLGRDRLLQEAVDHMVPEAYDEALREHELEPIGPPEVEILTLEPMRFKATVPLQPKVELGDYRSIALESEPVVVNDDRIAETVLGLRRQHAVLEPVDRPVQYNDRLRLDIRGVLKDRTFAREDNVEFSLREGTEVVVPGLAEQIVGLETGTDHQLEIALPQDVENQELAGETVTFHLTIHELKQEILPDLDDHFAGEVGDFDSLDALRLRITTDLREQETARVQGAFKDAVLAEAVQQATVEFPPMLVDREIEHMLADAARTRGQSLDAYLQGLGQDPKELAATLRPDAAKRVQQSLVLSELTKAEEITVSDPDIETEIARVSGDGPQAEQVRAVFDSENGRGIIRQNLITSRTLERLVALAGAAAAAQRAAPAGEDVDAESASSVPTEARSE